ncbi:hypothetical protein PQX77_003515, partial [Marasmius sp. AFHP31]
QSPTTPIHPHHQYPPNSHPKHPMWCWYPSGLLVRQISRRSFLVAIITSHRLC